MELLDRLIKTYKGKPLEQFFKDLRNEIDADQDTLPDLIEVMGKLTLPLYLKILGWLATAIMALAAVGMLLTSGK